MRTDQRLRILMILHDVRPADLARHLRLSPWKLSRVLHGQQQPSPETLRQIEEAIYRVDNAHREPVSEAA